jgi:hypothetical protein
MTALSIYDEVIRDFATAQHLTRIKKLLVYACTQRWESNTDRLAQFNLHDLIQTLMTLAPTLDQLQTYLHQVTQTLSKPAEYLLIANMIVQHLRPLYVGPISSPHLQANSHVYWQIAQTLEQETEHLRIRKLLVLVCRNYWEADRDRLLAIDLPELLMELHQLTQSLENLRAVIASVVQTTSKPVQYQAIADRIIDACQGFYPSTTSQETNLRSIDNSTASNPTHLQLNQLTQQELMSSSEHSSYPSFTASSGEQVGVSQPAQDQDCHADGKGDRRLYAQPIPTFSRPELYDLRLEIMKYAVPLLAKHLLFLIVYTPPGHASEQEQAEFAVDPDAWMSLKNRDLDDLIEESLKHYPTLDDLNAALQLTVRSLPNSQRHMSVATAIVRAVRTLMTKSTFARPELLDATSQKTSHQHHGADVEGTRQVFASTETFQEKSESQSQPYSSISSQHVAGGKQGAIASSSSHAVPSHPVASSASSSAETACLPMPDVPQSPHDQSMGSHSNDVQPNANGDHGHHRNGQQQPAVVHDSNRSNSTDETAFLT